MTLKTLIPFSFSSKEPVFALQKDINKLFDEIWRGNFSSSLTSSESFLLNPTMDVSDTGDAYDVTLEIPGVEKKDISIELKDNHLIIKGQKNVDRKSKEKDYYVAERVSGSFYRSLEMPQSVDFSHAKATFLNGVLSITLPKSKEYKTKPNKIEIS